MIHRRLFSTVPSALLALALIAGSASARAADGAGRATAGLGAWIAAQGNAALAALRDDLRQDLERKLKPMLPEDPAGSGFKKVATDSAEPAPAELAL